MSPRGFLSSHASPLLLLLLHVRLEASVFDRCIGPPHMSLPSDFEPVTFLYLNPELADLSSVTTVEDAVERYVNDFSHLPRLTLIHVNSYSFPFAGLRYHLYMERSTQSI
jgi:hypothetical protein